MASKKSKDFLEIGGSPVSGLTLRQVLRGHKSWIARIAWSPDGKYLASPSADKTIRIWETASGARVHTLQGHTKTVRSVAWSPNGMRLVSASGDQTICLCDAANDTLDDDRHPLVALLEAAKGYVGKDKQTYCDRLILELRTLLA